MRKHNNRLSACAMCLYLYVRIRAQKCDGNNKRTTDSGHTVNNATHLHQFIFNYSTLSHFFFFFVSFFSFLFLWFGTLAKPNREPSLTNSIYNYAIVSISSQTETHKSPVKSPQTTMLSIPKWKMKWKNVSKWKDHYAEPMPTKITRKCVVMFLIFDLNCDFVFALASVFVCSFILAFVLYYYYYCCA